MGFDVGRYTSLHDAAQTGSTAAIKWMNKLAATGLPDPIRRQAWISEKSHHGFTPLHKALQAGTRTGAVPSYLKMVWDAPHLDRAALHQIMLGATDNGQVHAIFTPASHFSVSAREHVGANANLVVEIAHSFRWTPVHSAAVSQDATSAEYFLDRLSEVGFTQDELKAALLGHTVGGQTVLHLAVSNAPDGRGAPVLKRILHLLQTDLILDRNEWHSLVLETNDAGDNLLHAALKRFDVDVLQEVREYRVCDGQHALLLSSQAVLAQTVPVNDSDTSLLTRRV